MRVLIDSGKTLAGVEVEEEPPRKKKRKVAKVKGRGKAEHGV